MMTANKIKNFFMAAPTRGRGLVQLLIAICLIGSLINIKDNPGLFHLPKKKKSGIRGGSTAVKIGNKCFLGKYFSNSFAIAPCVHRLGLWFFMSKYDVDFACVSGLFL